MISKEEIEKAKETSNSYIRAIDTFGTIDYKCINNLYTPIKTFLQYIDQLELEVRATEKVHEYDVKMIDEVKGEAVKLYKKIDKLNKIIDEMAKYIATDEKEFSTKICDDMSAKCETDTDCKLCIKQYFEKKVKKG